MPVSTSISALLDCVTYTCCRSLRPISGTRACSRCTPSGSIGNIKPLFPWHPRQRLPNPAPGGLAGARWPHAGPQDGGDTGPAWSWVTGRSRHHRLLAQAAAARGAGCHMGALGAAPDSSAMTRAARHVFLCAPTIVDTHAHLPQLPQRAPFRWYRLCCDGKIVFGLGVQERSDGAGIPMYAIVRWLYADRDFEACFPWCPPVARCRSGACSRILGTYNGTRSASVASPRPMAGPRASRTRAPTRRPGESADAPVHVHSGCERQSPPDGGRHLLRDRARPW